MSNIIDKFNSSKYVKFIANIVAFSSIIIWLVDSINNLKDNKMTWEEFDLIGLISAVLTTALLLFLIYLVSEMAKKIKDFDDKRYLFGIVSHIRSKRLFIKSFEQVEFLRLPNETDEDLKKRLPEYGLFNQFFMQEYEIVKKNLMKKYKNKTIEEIEDMLSEYYPVKK